MSKLPPELEPIALRNGLYSHDSFGRQRPHRPKPVHARVLDVGGWVAVGIICGGLFLWTGAFLLGGVWAFLWVLDALMRKLGA